MSSEDKPFTADPDQTKFSVGEEDGSGAENIDFKSNNPGFQSSSEDLPANQQKSGEVNWLGSSYTGQDIKVIAHLYDSLSDDISPKEQRLLDDKQYFEGIVIGADSLAAALPGITGISTVFDSWQNRIDALEEASSLKDSPEPGYQRALNYLKSQIAHSNLETYIGVARAQVQLQKISVGARKSKESIESQLDILQKTKALGSTSTIALGSLQTMSIQSHREKFGVRSLGFSYVKGYTRGPRTLAGSMIFVIFDEHPLLKLIRAMGADLTWQDPSLSTLLPDQLPPIDLTVTFANEYGSLSRLNIYGVEFINDGVTFSVDNLMSEQVMNFVCRDVDVMTKAGQMRLSKLQRTNGEITLESASNLVLGQPDYLRYLDILKVRRRLNNR